MRKNLPCLLPVPFLAACAQEIEFAEPASTTEVSQEALEFRTRSVEGAVYNEVVDAWMVPQPDPYTLKNFQAAYDALAAGNSTQTLSKAQSAEFAAGRKLAPTHYALKIYPHDEAEQWRVETMEDVQVSYIPFDYVQLTAQEVEKLPAAKVQAVGTSAARAFTFAEKSPYTVTYDYTHVTDGGQTGPRTFQLPILYTVWPVEKPLPEDLEFVVDYEIFLPRAATLSKIVESLSVLEGEALSMSMLPPGGGIVIPPFKPASTRVFVSAYDNTLNAYVPMRNLKVTVYYGSDIREGRTGNDGGYTLAAPPWENSASFRFTFQDLTGRWKIVPDNGSSAPYSLNIGTVSLLWGVAGIEVNNYIDLPNNNPYQAYEIHRTVNYYYNDQTVFEKHIPPTEGMKIFSAPESNTEAEAAFYFNSDYNIAPIIVVYNNGLSSGKVMGATLHEIGHFVHYFDVRDRYSYFSGTTDLLRESAAMYFGWFLGEEYYLTQGRTTYSGALDITGLGRQYWTNSNSSEYTPLFIDLTDEYNQSYDTFQGLPASDVWHTVTHSKYWADCKQNLRSYVTSRWCTSAQMEAYLAYYDYWFSN